MLRQLQTWAWIDGGTIAFIAGLINAAVYFLFGGMVGALLFQVMRECTLLIPATLTGLCGLGYGIYRQSIMRREARIGA